jgi:hypothetical protein
MKKETLIEIYFVTTLLFFTLLPSPMKFWQGVVLTCLAGGLVAITVPDAVKKYKALLSFPTDVADNQAFRGILHVFGDAMVAGLGALWALFVLGVGILTTIKYF